MTAFQALASNSLNEEQIEKMSDVHLFSASELEDLKVLHAESKDEKMLTTFRDLRSQLFEASQGANFTCLVTSVNPQGGATYVTRNLAAAIALDQTKTSVVVDCNMYAPKSEELLAADINVGLSDYLNTKEMGVEYIVYASGIKRLRVVPAGHAARSSAERLATPRMTQFLTEIKGRYSDRFVFIDSPSISEYPADVRVLAQLCDFVLLVVPYGMSSQDQLKASVGAIGQEKLVGVVFNKI